MTIDDIIKILEETKGMSDKEMKEYLLKEEKKMHRKISYIKYLWDKFYQSDYYEFIISFIIIMVIGCLLLFWVSLRI